MDGVKELDKTVFGKATSSSDPNRLYSILLDTKASSASENMYDISEKILINEKDNSKFALEQLWSLKKNLTDETENSTVDMLITFYQDKMNIVRQKEENIKKISTDSRELLEEKRKRDSEIANVKQEISECSTEINRLNSKLQQLTVKEQELQLIGGQLDKELQLNTNEVVNGLYEIILIGQDNVETDFTLDNELPEKSVDRETPIEKQAIDDNIELGKETQDRPNLSGEEKDAFDKYLTESVKKITSETAPYPKSIVKTTKGKVIGEYYYNPKVEKEKRNYIHNSSFFAQKLESVVARLALAFDEDLFAEAVQIVQDATRRIPDKNRIHFEISTNEILNGKSLYTVREDLNSRNYSEVIKFCKKITAKVTNLGSNYFKMLTEQMERYRSED